MPKDATILILGKRWRLRYCLREELPRDRDADCSDPAIPGKEIRVASSSQKQPQRLLELLIHEALHASNWQTFDETWVETVAHDIARMLWNQGFRLQEEP